MWDLFIGTISLVFWISFIAFICVLISLFAGEGSENGGGNTYNY
jgi:hypothetical protein